MKPGEEKGQLYIDKMIKRELVSLIISTVLILLIFIGISFASFIVTSQGESNVVEVDQIELTLCSSSTCNGGVQGYGQVIGTSGGDPVSIYPYATDTEAIATNPYIFDVENTGELDLLINAYLEEDTTFTPTGAYAGYTNAAQTFGQYIKVGVSLCPGGTVNREDVAVSLFSNLVNGVIVDDVSLEVGEKNTYCVWTWLANNTPNAVQESYFVANVRITGEYIPVVPTKPKITFSSNSSTSYSKSKTVYVTLGDSSGLVANQTVKYGWSTSNTTEPATYSTVSIGNTAGVTTATFAASSTNSLSGQYYLWVSPVESICNVNNVCSTAKAKTTGKFYFDNTGPTLWPLYSNAKYDSTFLYAVGSDTSGVATYYYSYVPLGSSCTTATYSPVTDSTFGVEFSSLADGWYYACYKAVDTLGNNSFTYEHAFEIYNASYSAVEGYYTWTAPSVGTYQFEAWGASGSSEGAYTSGKLYVSSMSTPYYLYLGGAPKSCYESSGAGCRGDYTAYNGGTMGGFVDDAYSTPLEIRFESGAGATDVRLTAGSWNNLASLRSRIMVAAGSGGVGGAAGNLTGYSTSDSTQGIDGGGGGQNYGGYGYTSTQTGGFGYGGNGTTQIAETANCTDAYGGGGGWYGGGGGYSVAAYCPGASCGGHCGNYTKSSAFAGGGSSFISGCYGCNAIDSSGNHTGSANHYLGTFTEPKMIDGKGILYNCSTSSSSVMPSPEGYTTNYASGRGHDGGGRIRITKIST